MDKKTKKSMDVVLNCNNPFLSALLSYKGVDECKKAEKRILKEKGFSKSQIKGYYEEPKKVKRSVKKASIVKVRIARNGKLMGAYKNSNGEIKERKVCRKTYNKFKFGKASNAKNPVRK
ncbi:MAG: hypothetical protein NTX92_09265 [Euryarchaeota archaeon]|nr:hypothetical protein [Euryarchaeota archaeon]